MNRDRKSADRRLMDPEPKTIRRKTRQTCSAEEKIRIVSAGLCREESVSVLYRPRPGRVKQSMIARGVNEHMLQLVERILGGWQTPSVRGHGTPSPTV
jgi:hypothetical protein